MSETLITTVIGSVTSIILALIAAGSSKRHSKSSGTTYALALAAVVALGLSITSLVVTYRTPKVIERTIQNVTDSNQWYTVETGEWDIGRRLVSVTAVTPTDNNFVELDGIRWGHKPDERVTNTAVGLRLRKSYRDHHDVRVFIRYK